jgi:hypothetical protein
MIAAEETFDGTGPFQPNFSNTAGFNFADFKGLFPDAPVNTFEQAGHFCQEDIPEILVALVHQFIQSNP